MPDNTIRGRFAPSPSGRLHLGNMLTFLLAWLDVRAAAGAPLQEALSLPTWPARSSFQNELLVPGMPLAAMPVESLYKAWSTQQGNAFGATRGLYLGDPARHLSQVYRELAIEVPAEFASMPDHLTLELELLALLLDAGNGEAARQLAADHLDWLCEYDAALADRADMVAHNEALPSVRRRNLLDGIAFLRARAADGGRSARLRERRRRRGRRRMTYPASAAASRRRAHR